MVNRKWLAMVELFLTNNEDFLKFWDPSLSTDDRNLLLLPTDTHDGGKLHYSIVCLNNHFVEYLEGFEQN